MGTWSWALAAAALFVFLFAVRTLFKSGGEAKREKLGCGFGLLALSIWTLAFSELLGSWVDGFRLAAGLVLLLPVAAAIAKPDGAHLLRAVVGLLLGALLAGPILSTAWEQIRPSHSRSALGELEEKIAELRGSLAGVESSADQLGRDRAELKGRVKAFGHDDFDALAADPAALQVLEELAEIDQLHDRAVAQIEYVRGRIPELEVELRRLERRLETEASLGGELSEADVQRLRDELEVQSELDTLTTVEEYDRTKRLEALFAEEF